MPWSLPPTSPARPAALFAPRNPRAAQVWAALSLAVAALTNALVQAVASDDGISPSTLLTTVGVVLGALVVVRARPERVAPWILLVPLLGVLVVVTLDLRSGDAGVTGQVFFVIPVVWAAAHLRVGGVAVVTAMTIAGEATVVFSILPRAQAWVEFTYLAVLVAVVGAVLARSAANQERLVRRLRELARVDPLTGLVTRRVLERATAALGSADRAALVLVDLDRFKTVNDVHGHRGGDLALVHVAEILTSRCRDSDVVARLGGDELAVLLRGCSIEDARTRADDLVRAVRETPLALPDGTRVPLTVSVGTAMHLFPGTPDELYERADVALYTAKRTGRDRAVLAAT
ncbi:diguanylate cyclase [Kineococcus gynurae]|uniref:Diguanylate cyclase n=1 Tax=Kineococcus gynurae TaxID=452979 RepID=A0ABV5LSE1_9ACTN